MRDYPYASLTAERVLGQSYAYLLTAMAKRGLLLDGAVQAFDAKAGSSTVTTDDLARLRELATAVNDIRAEKADRIQAAEKAVAEIEQLAASARGNEGEEATASVEETEEPAAEPEAAPEPEPKQLVTASAVVKPRALDLSRVPVHQPRVLPPDPNPKPAITASVDVLCYQPGQPLDMEGVTEGIIRRANAPRRPAAASACAQRKPHAQPPSGGEFLRLRHHWFCGR